MLEKHRIACDLMRGLHWNKWTSSTPTERLQLIHAGPEDGKSGRLGSVRPLLAGA